MPTVKPPPSYTQDDLFPELVPDKPLGRTGEARTRYGEVVNLAVNGLLRLEDIPNSGSHDIVFDSFLRSRETFIEVKSLRRKNKCPIYEWRRNKDRDCGVPLIYIFGIHGCKECGTLAEVWHRMADTMNTLLVMPAWAVDLEARKHGLRQIKTNKTASGKRNGYQRRGYADGYRNIPYADLYRPALLGERRPVETFVCGVEFSATAYFHPAIEPWL